MFSLEHAKETFHNYVSQYDLNDPKIALKVRHTYAVVDASGIWPIHWNWMKKTVIWRCLSDFCMI